MNLIKQGLEAQQRIVDANALVGVIRIVGGDENLHEVMQEAKSQGKFVYANPDKQRTVIASCKPGLGWYKVHGVHRMPSFDDPEAA